MIWDRDDKNGVSFHIRRMLEDSQTWDSSGGGHGWLNAGQCATLAALRDRLCDKGLPGTILADEVGMGKTRIAVALARAVTGAGGRDLREQWRGGAHAYLGVTVSGFPNLFMLYGPNTNLGHNSILVMIEAQVGYILDAIRQMDAQGLRRLEVKREVMDEYNRALQLDLAKSVWAADKHSWYKLADGTITNNWPHSTIRYRRLLRRADLAAYDTGP
jgi:hypothetical protein